MQNVYEAKNYRDFINSALDSERFGRGARTQLSEFLGVRSSFVSYVLTGNQDFTLEHGYRIAEFLRMNKQERAFLLLLIQRDRAGSKDLRDHFQELLDQKLSEFKLVASRIKRESKKLTEGELAEYFSAWYHQAIHMILRNPKFQDPRHIAETLGLEGHVVRASLEVLERLGFIKKAKTGWENLQKSLHLEERSPVMHMHHANWRTEAIRSLPTRRNSDIRYTAVMSIDQECMEKIRASILKTLEECDPAVREAKDEELHVLTIDLFRIG